MVESALGFVGNEAYNFNIGFFSVHKDRGISLVKLKYDDVWVIIIV
jgi:hypothetical protein